MEVIKMQDKYKRVFIAWQFLEIQDCLLRSRNHSKWTAFIDLDERISTNGQRMADLLQSIQDPGIGEILIQVMSIVKDKDYPANYKNSKELENELKFKKYNQSLTPTWKGKKAIVRSDKIGIMSVHYAIAKYPGIKTLFANSTLAVLRHLRSTKHRINGSAWHLTPNENGTLLIFREVPLPPTFSETLREAIIKRVQFVYKTIPVNCSTIRSHLANMINHPDPCSKPWPDF